MTAKSRSVAHLNLEPTMQWSFPIARIFGTDIRIHVTFFLLLAWIAIAQYQNGGQAAAVDGVVFIIAIFACVVLHELGHVFAARRYGIATPRITLLPIGGVAELERMPEKPGQEIVVAIAGPLVNVAIALILVVVFGARFDAGAIATIENPGPGFATRLAAVNIWLVLFNLIPAFPMDGGRVLRALLALRYGRARATNVAAGIGQGLAFVFGFLGLISGNVLLVFVAIFVYLAASGEAMAVNLQDATRDLRVADAMITRFATLGPQATLSEAADLLLSTAQHEFPVVDGAGGLRGVLTREAMVAALAKSGRDAPVIDAMARDVPVVRPEGNLEAALKGLEAGRVPVIGVADAAGKFLGYINRENIGELLMLRAATQKG